MTSLPATKPTGPYELYVKEEAAAFTFTAFAATDPVRHLVCSFGDSVRPREEIDESRGDRGAYAEVLGDYPEIPWSIETRFWGSGAAGTPIASRKALYEAAAGLSEVDAGTVTYETDVANPAKTVSMYRVDRQGVSGEYLIGAICQQIVIDLNKQDAPKITYSGVAARKWEFSATTLAAEIAAAGTLEMTLTDQDRIRTGDAAMIQTGLEIYALIETEVVKITAMNWTTGVATITRAAFGTVAAAHATALAVTPYNSTPTFGEAGLVIGPHDWTTTGGPTNIRSMQYTLETGRAFDDLQSGSASRDGLHNKHIKGAGSISYILNSDRAALQRTNTDEGVDLDLAFVLGDTAGSIFTINLDAARLVDGVPKDLPYNEPLEVTQNFRTRDTQAALLGQLQIVES